MAFDLNALPAQYLAKYGLEKFAAVVGKSHAVASMQLKRGKVPLDDVAKLLAFDPAPLAEIKPLYENPAPGTKLVILMPLSGPIQPKTLDTFARLFDKREMDFRRFGFNCLSVSRNVLAGEFMRGPWQWAWWMDGDALLPAGDAAWFREAADIKEIPDAFAGLNSIYRALHHKKSIVSCSYIARRKGGPPQFGGGNSPEMKALVKRGPRDKLIEVPWAGFHGILTHRSVFEDIVKTQGDEIKMAPGGIGERFRYSHAFFHPEDRETPGDDLPWCKRAIRAGHKIHVDLAIAGAHVGDRAYSYQDL
jgi:hypothetical protein